MSDVCNVPGCEGEPHSRGVCPSHYAQWNKYDRFSEYVEKSKLLGVTARDHELYSTWQELSPMCERWRESFWAFEYDVGRRPSGIHRLARKDTRRDFGPDNVQWILTTKEDFDP